MSKFRSSINSRYLQGLFFEQTGEDKSTVLYTLKDFDHLGYPSLYRLYMESDDPTEYAFATTHLESWDHFQMLCRCTWFEPFITRWREELEVRLRAKALLQLRALASANTKDSFAANKYLLSGSWKPAGASKRGRPSKDQIKEEAHRLASESQQVNDDLFRIKGLNS